MTQTTKKQLESHIMEKIKYHNKLRLQAEQEEKYEECARHRDEIIRLNRLLYGRRN